MTELGNGNTYQYDANGNMTLRVEDGVTYEQEFDAENHLVFLTTNNETTHFIYDGDGNLVVKFNPDNTSTIYIGSVYEVNRNNWGGMDGSTTYYPAAGAMRVNGTLYYVLKDKLGSASVVLNDTGGTVGDTRYYPFGETRETSGSLLTDRLFTGQREMAGLGIYNYGARFYSPGLGRFIQPDILVPGPGNSQSFNRFSYVNNNPIRYNDPSGHGINCGIGDKCDPGVRSLDLKAAKTNAKSKASTTKVTISTPRTNEDDELDRPSIPRIPTQPPYVPPESPIIPPLPPSPSEILPYCPTSPTISPWQKPDWWDTDPSHPDYYTLTINRGSLYGLTGTVTIDRYGNIYVGGGGNIGKSISPLTVSLNGGFIGSSTDNSFPDQANTLAFLQGVAINAQIGAVGDIAVTFSPSAGKYVSNTAVEYGGILPFAIGISATYNKAIFIPNPF